MFDESIAARMQGLDVLVGVSGGKDSVVTLALACKYAASVRGFFMYMYPHLDFQRGYIEQLERRFGVQVDWIPHPGRMRWLHQGTYRQAADLDSPIVDYGEIYSQLREQTGRTWIVAGEKKCDSLQRRGMISKSGGFDEKRQWIYPLADWSHRQVYRYLKQHGLPLAPDYSLGLRESFGGQYANELLKVKERFPDDFQEIKDEFPFIEALFIRERITARGKQVSRVRADDDSSEPDNAGGVQPKKHRRSRAKKPAGVNQEEHAS